MTRKPRPTMPASDAKMADLLSDFILAMMKPIENHDVRLQALLMAAAITATVTEEAENSGAAIEAYRRMDAAVAAVVDLMDRGVVLPLRR